MKIYRLFKSDFSFGVFHVMAVGFLIFLNRFSDVNGLR